MAETLTVTIVEDAPKARKPERLTVECIGDGSLIIRADIVTAALLAGRTEFGSVDEAQEKLRDLIADAWYAAGCPS